MLTLDPRVITLWRLQAVVRLATFWLPVFVGLGGFIAFRGHVAVGASVGVGGVLGMLAVSMVWPALQHARFRYSLREHDLLVEQGVLFHQTVSVPLNRIQHIDTRSGPLERWSGVSRLLVYTAAGFVADGSIPGLDEAEAHRLRDLLARRGGDDGV